MKMDKEMLRIILFALVIDFQYVNANNFSYDQAHHTEPKTWKAASDECGNHGLEFDENVLKKTDGLLDKEFWIGMAIYRVTTPWIEILGCSKVQDRRTVRKSPSVVLCQRQCESYQFFGYSESTEICSCQHDKVRSYNITNCIDQNNSTYLFVYKVLSGKFSGYDSNWKCTTLECKDGRTVHKATNCDDKDTRRASICNDGHKIGWGKPYSISKQMCLERNQLLLPPETYCTTNSHAEGIPAWTNVFRAETEAKLTRVEAGTGQPIHCLKGLISENRVLNITRRACNDPLEFVCRTGEATTTIPTQSTIITRTRKDGLSASFEIGPVIGGIVSALLLLALFIVVIFCKIRSCGFFQTTSMDKQKVLFSTAVCEHLQNSEVRTTVTPTSSESYGLAPITSNNTYAVVNKIKTNGLQTTEDTYTETSYAEYDRLNGVSKRRIDSKENLYDSHAGIRNESDPTYDSSNHEGRNLQLDNDVYDHTDTVSTDGSDYGYSSTNKSEVRNENDVYDKAV